MNTRIQDLINQSWNTVEGPPREGMEDIRQILMEDLNPIFLELARLMVQECARVASDYDGAHYVGTAIEKHFGIEK